MRGSVMERSTSQVLIVVRFFLVYGRYFENFAFCEVSLSLGPRREPQSSELEGA